MVGMYVARVPNRNSPPAYLIRESYREGGKVKTRTIANITRLGADKDTRIINCGIVLASD